MAGTITPEQVAEAQQALRLLANFVQGDIKTYCLYLSDDGPLAFSVYSQIQTAIAKVNAAGAKSFATYAEAFGAPAGTPGHTVCELIDLVMKQVKEIKAAQTAKQLPPTQAS